MSTRQITTTHAREIKRKVITTEATAAATAICHDIMTVKPTVHTWNAVQLEKLSVMHTTYLLGPALEAMIGSMLSPASRMAAVNDVNGRWTMGAASSIRIRENFRFVVMDL
jgi:hypothetical protein